MTTSNGGLLRAATSFVSVSTACDAVSTALTVRAQTATTEVARPDLADLDLRSTRDLVRLLNEEDATVPAAVAEAGDSLAAAIDAIVERLSL